jgi:hypothetical protein
MVGSHARRLECVDKDRHHDEAAADAKQARKETRRNSTQSEHSNHKLSAHGISRLKIPSAAAAFLLRCALR